MRPPAWCVAATLLGISIGPGKPGCLRAQGTTTAAVSGRVRTPVGDPVDGAEVEVIDRETGVTSRSVTHHGRFQLLTLEVGGPYSIVIRQIGFRPAVVDSLFLAVGENRVLDLRLQPVAVELLPVSASGNGQPATSILAGGVGSLISDSMLHRLPTANRDLYDFVVLTPQISNVFGIEGGGVNARYNDFVIDGATEQALHGRNPAGAAVGKTISIEAVKEYQVVLTSYDVAQGDFAGASVNAATKNGTNEFHGSAFGYLRNEQLARDVPALRDSPYDRAQYGFTLGGPIIRDRIHFFIAPEFQHLSSPAPGPYLGQPDSSVPVTSAEVARFKSILHNTWGLDAGSGGPVSNQNPLANLFVRLDFALPGWNSRLVLRDNYSHGVEDNLDRSGGGPFPLSSVGSQQIGSSNVPALELYTGTRNGGSNELIASYYNGPFKFVPNVPSPTVIAAVPGTGGTGTALIQSGTTGLTESGSGIDQRSIEITDNLRLPVGSTHLLTVGTRLEFFRLRRVAVPGSYGSWEFASLDSLEQGVASSYTVSRDFGGGDASFTGTQLALYAGDRWQLKPRLSVTAGLRGELPVINGHPPYSAAVDSAFGRRTDAVPGARLLLSPRAGFEWRLDGAGRNQLRGGIGVFIARAPLTWWLNAWQFYGVGVKTLSCGRNPGDAGSPPPFNPDFQHPPLTCANGAGFDATSGGKVNLLDPGLSYPRSLRVSLGYDRRLPWDVLGTVEVLYTKGTNDLLFINKALNGPVGTDPHGRVLYGTFDQSGVAAPSLVSGRFPDVIDLVNNSRNYSWDVSVQLEKRFSNRLEARLAYNYSRVRDVQTPTNPFASGNINGPAVSGRLDALPLEISDADQPHRAVAAATWTAPWRAWSTDLSVYYVGGSGIPFTYTAVQNGTGDLNADGVESDDPIYVPRNTAYPAEIRFGGTAAEVAAQQQALEAFIAGTPCLRNQRGRILERNSCRSPWVHTLNAAVRQFIPGPWGRGFSLELQVFNLLNVLNGSWGFVNLPNTELLSRVAQTTGPPSQSASIFRFDPKFAPYSPSSPDSYYQLQVAVRYSF